MDYMEHIEYWRQKISAILKKCSKCPCFRADKCSDCKEYDGKECCANVIPYCTAEECTTTKEEYKKLKRKL